MVWLDSMACWAMDILNSRVLSDGLRLSVEALCAWWWDDGAIGLADVAGGGPCKRWIRSRWECGEEEHHPPSLQLQIRKKNLPPFWASNRDENSRFTELALTNLELENQHSPTPYILAATSITITSVFHPKVLLLLVATIVSNRINIIYFQFQGRSWQQKSSAWESIRR